MGCSSRARLPPLPLISCLTVSTVIASGLLFLYLFMQWFSLCISHRVRHYILKVATIVIFACCCASHLAAVFAASSLLSRRLRRLVSASGGAHREAGDRCNLWLSSRVLLALLLFLSPSGLHAMQHDWRPSSELVSFRDRGASSPPLQAASVAPGIDLRNQPMHMYRPILLRTCRAQTSCGSSDKQPTASAHTMTLIRLPLIRPTPPPQREAGLLHHRHNAPWPQDDTSSSDEDEMEKDLAPPRASSRKQRRQIIRS